MHRFVALLICLMSGIGTSAAADLVDCNGAPFRTYIKADKAFACEELGREDIVAGGSSVVIRAVKDKSTDIQWVDQYVQQALDAAANSISAYDAYAQQLGFKFANVTIVALDPGTVKESFGGEAFNGAYADADPWKFQGDCIVRVHIPNLAQMDADFIRAVMAHEVFHCVQGWSFEKATTIDQEAAKWWVEGTAVFFAGFVQDERSNLEKHAQEFANSIGVKPLTQQSYASVPFFAYVWSEGPDKMASFFAGLSETKSEDAQQDATLAALGEDTLQRFGQALIDGKIALPNGYTFPAPPDQVETTTIDDDQKMIELEVKRFTLVRHALHFVNGTYNAWAGGSPFYKRDQMGGEWSELDPSEQIEPDNCKDIKMVLTARFITEGFASKTALSASRLKKCLECTKMPKVDQCVVGKWQMSNEALLTYLQATNGQNQATNFSGVGGSAFLVFNKDGTAQFVAEGLKIGAEVKIAEDNEDMILVNVEANGIDSGEWGTGEGGAMNYCAKETSLAFNIRVELPTGLVNESEEQGLLSDSVWSYSCAGNDLALRYVGPNTLPDGIEPRWQLTRAP
jgi:hypothetical protein